MARLTDFHHQQERTESDLFLCKYKDQEPLQNYFRRFVHLRALAPNVLDAVAINTVLTVETRNNLRSSSVWTYTFFITGRPLRFLSIRGERGLIALNQVLI
jgi:hypothetical protein